MRISSSLFTNNLQAQMNQLQTTQTQLQDEVSSGLSVTQPQDNPGVMNQALILQEQNSANTQYQNNISQLQTTATASGNAMNSLQTIAEQAGEIATEAGGSATTTQTQLTNYAQQVGNLIQEALQTANTQDANGNYVFGGSLNNQPPFVATTDASGNVTSVSYQGNTDTPAAQIGENQTISAVTPGANTTGTGPQGLLVNSSTGADLFSHLISLQQNLASGNTSAISTTDATNLKNDEDNIVSGIAANGVVQATLNSASNTATQTGTNLNTAVSNLTSANMADTLTQLDQIQTSFQAAMQSGVMIMNLSILNFIQ